MQRKYEKQLSLFGDTDNPVRSNVPRIKHHHKRKYSLKHWSYRQRLVHEISQSKSISWKDVYQLLNSAIAHQGVVSSLTVRHGRRFATTVNQSNLNKAVRAMYQRKYGNYPLSVNKIAEKFKVSKPSLYRAYKSKYKNSHQK